MEQLHKIFKLCGSPSEDYWRKSKLPQHLLWRVRCEILECLLYCSHLWNATLWVHIESGCWYWENHKLLWTKVVGFLAALSFLMSSFCIFTHVLKIMLLYHLFLMCSPLCIHIVSTTWIWLKMDAVCLAQLKFCTAFLVVDYCFKTWVCIAHYSFILVYYLVLLNEASTLWSFKLAKVSS